MTDQKRGAIVMPIFLGGGADVNRDASAHDWLGKGRASTAHHRWRCDACFI